LRVVARLRVSLKRALACSLSEPLHWRDLTLRYADAAGFFFTNYRSAEIRDFSVDLVKRVLRKLLGWREVFPKLGYVLLRAFDLIGRQRIKNSMHRFNFRHAMANHHHVVSGREGEANGVV
jgi:hypothetical protein